MEGPTVYEVEPSNAVICDDGSEAYYVGDSGLAQLNLKQNTSAKIALDVSVSGKDFQLVGFAPTSELIGHSKAKVWAYDPVSHTLRVVFRAPAKKRFNSSVSMKSSA